MPDGEALEGFFMRPPKDFPANEGLASPSQGHCSATAHPSSFDASFRRVTPNPDCKRPVFRPRKKHSAEPKLCHNGDQSDIAGGHSW
jgi:hypothetical protein